MTDTSTGVDARLSSVLCYAGWWITGLVFLFAERRHGGVRFHAAQSIVVFGAFSLAFVLTGGISAVTFVLAAPTFQLFAVARRRGDVALPVAHRVARRNLGSPAGRQPGAKISHAGYKIKEVRISSLPPCLLLSSSLELLVSCAYSVFGTSIFGTLFGFTTPLAWMKL